MPRPRGGVYLRLRARRQLERRPSIGTPLGFEEVERAVGSDTSAVLFAFSRDFLRIVMREPHIPRMKRNRRRRPLEWATITERDWKPHLGRLFPWLKHGIRRVSPGTAEYEQVVDLRYAGFVESGFLDASKTGREAMRLARDFDSIILGLFRRKRLVATVTLNTITDRFPGMAMELEKNVVVNHRHFRDPNVLEIAKLVVDGSVRGRRFVLGLLSAASLIARLLGKEHLWQVSRDSPEDISWRVGLGFDYSLGYAFSDASLNNMPSRVGYLFLPSVTHNPRVPGFIKSIYASVLELERGGASA